MVKSSDQRRFRPSAALQQSSLVVLSTVNALNGVQALLIKNGRMLGLSGYKLLVKVEGPAALSRIAVDLQIRVTTGWIAVIAAEFLDNTTTRPQPGSTGQVGGVSVA